MVGWLRPKSAAKYCGVGERTLRTWLKDKGLRFSKVRGTTLIKIEWIDQFLSQREVSRDNLIDTIVDEIVKDLR